MGDCLNCDYGDWSDWEGELGWVPRIGDGDGGVTLIPALSLRERG